MTKKSPLWVRSINWLSEVSGYLSGLAIFLATIFIVHQVVVRYFLKESTIWQTELSIYMLLFTSFVGAAYGLKHNSHVGIDLIIQKLSPRVQILLRIITSIFCFLLTIIVAWKAWEMWYHVTALAQKSSTVWGVPLTYPYFMLPFGMTLVSLQYIAIIYEEFINLKRNNINVDLKNDSSKSI